MSKTKLLKNMAKKFGHLYWDPVDSAVFKDAVKRYTPKTMGGKVATATAGGLGLMAMFGGDDENSKDRFGYGVKDDVSFDDPWGDNVSVPYKNGKMLTGKDAEPWNDTTGDGLESILYKGHTNQKINKNDYSQEDLARAIDWYSEAKKSVQERLIKYKDRPDVINAQKEKMAEINRVLSQLIR